MENGKQFSEQVRTIRWRMKREQFDFSREVRIIPRKAFYAAIALLAAGLVGGGIVSVFDRSIPGVAAIGIGIAAAVGIDICILLFTYVYCDAQRRGMNALLWTLLAIIVPYLIGLIVYFLVRDPLPFNCPQCGATVSARFNYCPHCKCNLHPSCPQCKREVRESDRFCPHCAYELAGPRHEADAKMEIQPGAGL